MNQQPVHALILAAGLSRRMGAVKQLLLTDGIPLVRRCALAVTNAGLTSVTAILPPSAPEMSAALAGLNIATVTNEQPENGILSSLKVGLRALPAQKRDDEGVMIVLADQPLISSHQFAQLATNFRKNRGQAIIRPVFASLRGNPVTLPRLFSREILEQGDSDRGAAFILARYPELIVDVEMTSDGVVFDVDTPQDFAVLGVRLQGTAAEKV